MDYALTAAELAALSEETAKRRDVAEAAVRKTTIDQTAETALAHALAPDGVVGNYDVKPTIDDDLPPGTPANVAIEPLAHGLGVSWDAPLSSWRAKYAELRVTPPTGPAFVLRSSTLLGHALFDLLAEEAYLIEARFVDAFTEAGDWSVPAPGIPNRSVAEQIDFSFANVFGELGYENISELNDPAKVGDAVIQARSFAAQNAAAFNLWAENAMIQSAKIADLSADKIETGTLEAATVYLSATGSLQAGPHTKLDSGGVELGLASSYDTPSEEASYKIAGEGDFSALMFYSNVSIAAEGNFRGAILRSDGVPGAQAGALVVHATATGDIDQPSSALLHVLAKPDTGSGQVDVHQNLNVAQDASVARDAYVKRALIGAGGPSPEVMLANNTGTIFTIGAFGYEEAPRWISVKVSVDRVTWQEADGLAGWSVQVTTGGIRVDNASGAARYVRMRCIG